VAHRKVGPLANSDFVMTQVFWIGVFPGLTLDMLGYIIEETGQFIQLGKYGGI